jgi:energy-converting hydrogenase Eha subunit A
MSSVAKYYIALVVASGTGILLLAARWWSSAGLPQFAALLCFTLLASTLKVRIPGMTSTISPNFAFLLIAMAFFSFSQVIVAALCAALLQSFWRPKSPPRLVQVLFSAAALVMSSALAFAASRLIVRPFDANNVVALVLLAGTLYLSMNTVLVSIVVGLTEQQPIRQVWQHCYEWVFPYFAFGIVVIGLMGGSFSTMTAWRSSLQVAPAMVLAYLYFLGRSKKQAENRALSEEAEELLTVSSLER